MFFKFTAEMITCSPRNMILLPVFYQLLMFIGHHILLGRFKLGDEALDLSGVDAKSFGSGSDADFILDDGHEF